MKKVQWPLKAIIFVGLLQVVSCTKTADTVTFKSDNLESVSNATVANEFSNCKLRRIYQDVVFYGTNPPISAIPLYGLFSYNSAGNPYSLVFREPSTNNVRVGSPSYFFFYDNQQRLKELRKSYDEGATFPVFHRYGYIGGSNRIATDTFIRPDNASIGYMDVSTFTYDSQGRIVKENIKNLRLEGYPLKPDRNPTFTYDSRGNIAVAGWKSSWYDNKVSYLSSHPLFMFLTRNYSKNNPLKPEDVGRTYNSKGLPLTIKMGNDEFFESVNIERLVYDCQ